jgi:SAM-dependent methyltransferase
VSTYLLANQATEAADRFAALSRVFNGWTFRHFQAVGIDRGWRCWEVGAGGPSVPRWLAREVGPSGSVIATDIDVSWLPTDRGFQVTRHDVVHDEPPGRDFDLVHARLVLTHLPERDEALRRMASALRPGGWLLVEDFDVQLQPLACIGADGPDAARANRIRAGFVALLAERGVDMALGRSLPGRLRTLGLDDVRADAYTPIVRPATADLELANTLQVRAGLLGLGLTPDDIERHIEALTRRTLDITSPPLVSAWGRRD